ncbi:hypothetical protein SCUCBS95973_001070 [Sporothrix curviconia]|uniref:Uncharacterized protein n=1 Tax=Sporothrix curviconia TaxID=1260050 RepID=A0ABP0AVN1_9PEZI
MCRAIKTVFFYMSCRHGFLRLTNMEPCGTAALCADMEEINRFLDQQPGFCECCIHGRDVFSEPTHMMPGVVDFSTLQFVRDISYNALPGLSIEGSLNQDYDFLGIDNASVSLDVIVNGENGVPEDGPEDEASMDEIQMAMAANVEMEAAGAQPDDYFDTVPSHGVWGFDDESMGVGELGALMGLDDASLDSLANNDGLVNNNGPVNHDTLLNSPARPNPQLVTPTGTPVRNRQNPTSFATVAEVRALMFDILQNTPP